MKRIVLFSVISSVNSEFVLSQIFSSEIEHKIIAYMPSDGLVHSESYVAEWRGYAQSKNAEFRVIDNHSPSKAEKDKLLSSNILVLSGGNTFALLNNLRTSGLDETILEFAQNPENIIAGYSAGAIVLTPTIAVCNLPHFDTNEIGLTDLRSLQLIDFEVFPHYRAEAHLDALKNYQANAQNTVRIITDDEYIIVDS